MRASVAAVVSVNRNRFLKTTAHRHPFRGVVRGIPVQVGDWRIWEGVATPGFIRDEANLLRAEVDSFASSVIADLKKNKIVENIPNPNPVGSAQFILHELEVINKIANKSSPLVTFTTGFLTPFYKQVSEFVGDHQSWTDNLWGNILDTINSYRARLVTMYATYKEISPDFVAPAPKEPGRFGDQGSTDALKGLAGPAKEIWKVVKIIIYAGLVIIGIIVLKGFIYKPSIVGVGK